MIIGQLVHFLGFGNWQSYMTVIPVIAFFMAACQEIPQLVQGECAPL